MTEYLVKLGFWLRAYDSLTIEAASDSQALEKAREAAKAAMESRADPEAIDTDQRREGVIAYIDRLGPGCREAVAEGVAFDDDRIHGSLHEFVRRIVALPANGPTPIADSTDATGRCRALIDEAQKLLDAWA
jgi:hypothetical protein